MPTYTDVKKMSYSAKQMFDLVADVEAYPDFLPWIAKAVIPKREEFNFTADLTIGYKFLHDQYTSKVILKPSERIDVEYVNGPFKHLKNYWIFHPISETECEVEFYIDFQFNASLLEGFITPIFSEAVKTIINAFKKRAEEIYPSTVSSAG